MRVLVVDDEDAVRDLVTNAMIDRGYQVWSASSGKQALELAAEYDFDLVFCDVVMDGLSGFDVLKAFRKNTAKESEIVLMTDQASVEAAIEAVQKGANDYICKPFSISVLQAIASAVEQRRYPGKLIEIETQKAAPNGIIRLEDLPSEMVSTPTVASVMNQILPDGELPTLEQLEGNYLLRVLSAVGGNKSRAAQILGVDRKTLYRMIDRQAAESSEKASASASSDMRNGNY